jgi:hypothetical protein
LSAITFMVGAARVPGATQVAAWAMDSSSGMVGYHTMGNGKTSVQINGFIGAESQMTGDWGKLIVNAARWLKPSIICPTSTPVPGSPTPTATPSCLNGLLVGSGLAIGLPQNNFTLLASNIVSYTWANSQPATNQFAIFQAHDPWFTTVIRTAITNAGHTYTVFAPYQLLGFNFSQYRVVILNWEDHFTRDFQPYYTNAIPALQTYIQGGGVVWVQGALLGSQGDSYPMPFGGTAIYDQQNNEYIMDPSSPMVQGVPNPFGVQEASLTDFPIGLPAGAHVVVRAESDTGFASLYDYRPVVPCVTGTPGTPTPTPAQATATPINTPSNSSTATSTATSTRTGTPTSTTAISATATSTTAFPTNTTSPTNTTLPSTSTATRTIVPSTSTSTRTSILATATATATSTPCAITFVDVPPGSTFYTYIRCLACRGIVSGYQDGTFRPNANVTRGQLSKIVSNAASFSENHTEQTFQDVPIGSTFHQFIERLASRGVISGYTCGGAGEPCIPPQNRPYFRPGSNVTRGQTTKIVAIAAGLPDPPTGSQSFEDIPPTHTFYRWIERMALDGIISGYTCGGDGEPCVPPLNRPYFRSNANVTRGQASKIVSNTFFPNCDTPSSHLLRARETEALHSHKQ